MAFPLSGGGGGGSISQVFVLQFAQALCIFWIQVQTDRLTLIEFSALLECNKKCIVFKYIKVYKPVYRYSNFAQHYIAIKLHFGISIYLFIL